MIRVRNNVLKTESNVELKKLLVHGSLIGSTVESCILYVYY